MTESNGVETKRILIADDEELARRRLARYVRQAGGCEIAEAASGLEAVALIESFRPEIVFLDIEMPELDGFEVLAQFSERPFHVIFQTAYDEFAIRAFQEHACDYLLKPFTAERLNEALARALRRLGDEQRLRQLEAQLAAHRGALRRLTVRQGRRWRLIEEEQITCFISRDHCTCVYFEVGAERGEGLVELSLAELRERLDSQLFRQFHRNHLVRIGAVRALAAGGDGELTLELIDGRKLPVARRARREARAMVG